MSMVSWHPIGFQVHSKWIQSFPCLIVWSKVFGDSRLLSEINIRHKNRRRRAVSWVERFSIISCFQQALICSQIYPSCTTLSSELKQIRPSKVLGKLLDQYIWESPLKEINSISITFPPLMAPEGAVKRGLQFSNMHTSCGISDPLKTCSFGSFHIAHMARLEW